MVAFTPETHAYFDVCFPVLITTSPKENFQLDKEVKRTTHVWSSYPWDTSMEEQRLKLS